MRWVNVLCGSEVGQDVEWKGGGARCWVEVRRAGVCGGSEEREGAERARNYLGSVKIPFQHVYMNGKVEGVYEVNTLLHEPSTYVQAVCTLVVLP